MIQLIQSIVNAFLTWFNQIVKFLTYWFSQLIETLNNSFDTVIQWFQDLFNFLLGYFREFAKAFQGLFDFAVNTGWWFQVKMGEIAYGASQTLPNPPFKFSQAIDSVNSLLPGVPWGIFTPHLTAIGGLIGVRVSLSAIKFLKGWL